MRKTWIVMRREYLERVTKRSFWVGTLVFPVALVAIFALAIGAQFLSPRTQKRLALIDETGRLHAPLVENLADNTLDGDEPEYIIENVPLDGSPEETRRRLEAEVLAEEMYGIIETSADLDPNAGFRLYRRNVGDDDVSRTLRRALQNAVIGLRLERSGLGLSRETLDEFVEPILLTNYEISASGQAQEKDPVVAQAGMLIFSMILYFTLYFYGFSATRGIIAEKSTRVMEVLLGSISHNQLMTGKILGIALVGLTQILFYTATAWTARIIILVKASGQDLGAILELIAPGRLAFFVGFFLLGYFLYTAMFAIIGAVSNSEQDAQNLQFPLIAMLMIPYLMSVFFVKHPDSLPAVLASLFPPFMPMVMFMRISVLTPPVWQIALSIVLMIAAILVLLRAAAKVFRIGTLMHGKRPTIPEILRWARS